MRTGEKSNKKQAAARMTKKVLIIVLGAAIYTFGIHNIHQRTAITEGGIIGLMLLIEHWFSISPGYITPVLDFLCYLLAFRFLGGGFIRDSIIATLAVSGWYKVWEQFPPMLPDLSAHPLAAALAGALFVGVGVGLIIRQGGSGSGDDALALTISHVTGWRLSGLTVLALSLSYIPFQRILFSLITVTASSFLIDRVQDLGRGGAPRGGGQPAQAETA